MKFLRDFLDKKATDFEPGGKLETFHALYEAPDTLLFTPGEVTKGSTHVRDALDLKRMMITVVIALIPCVLMAMYNTGYQANLAIGSGGALPLDNWQTSIYQWMGLAFDATSMLACVVHGALYFLPVFLVTAAIGGNVEMGFAVVRKHEINEGFLVTLFLFPLILPPTIPLWQVAIGIVFGVIVAKEVFGGTGMNVLNVALTARAFLFFAYPAEISGDKVWIAAEMVDGSGGATWLAVAAAGGAMPEDTMMNAFLGLVPGSMGETSALACLLGAAVLIGTGIGSWRTMAGVTIGTAAFALLFNAIGSDTNAMFGLPWYTHFVLGGWMFGMVFMATDPVTSAFSAKGKLVYGFGIGMMVVLVRVVNPAYPEGMMLAILFMNMFAPLIDHFVVQGNIKRRAKRLVAHGA